MPERLWEQVAEFTRSAVTDARPKDATQAGLALAAVARIAAWSIEVKGLRLERRIVFDTRNISAYIQFMAIRRGKATVKNRRALLLWLGRELAIPDLARGPISKASGSEMHEPYTPAEVVRFRTLAASRTTVLRQHNWWVLLTFGLGCGLSSSEIFYLSVGDVLHTEEGVRVRVRGHHPRTVICLAQWEEQVLRILSSPLIGSSLYVTGVTTRDPATVISSMLKKSSDGPNRFTVERLRATWLSQHVSSGVDLFVLLNQMGAANLRALDRFRPYAFSPPDSDVMSMMRRDGTL